LAIGLALLEVTSKADDSINHRLDSFIGGTSAEARPGTIETMQDRKELFRQLLVELGGLSTDALAEQFKRLAKRLGLNGTTLKDLRSSISTDMERSGIDLLNLRYLTSHSTNDIMNEYVSLNPCAAMAKYFATIAPLLGALAERSRYLGI
jgi:hypothetical protein